MRKRKSLVWSGLGLLVVASLVLAACAPAAPATEAAPESTEEAIDRNYSPEIPDPTETVTITFASFNDLETPFWQGMREEFEAVHPNINVEFQVVPGDGLYEKLLTEVAAGNPPDTAYLSDWMTGDFVQQGALVSLDD
ncbi:MAG TPA: extracellular solute-binding protein, partial [Anaerolineales bacterium]|nr:extracellular solute-binding protein [Anaerolineales bacterium]